MRLWVDDLRPAPSGKWVHARSVYEALAAINFYERHYSDDSIIISLDHDAGNYAEFGGDYIRILDFLEKANCVDTGYFFHLHTMNPVGRDNMRRIIQKNGWKEIYDVS